MTEERFNEIENNFFQEIDMNQWDPTGILCPNTFVIGYLAGKGISILESMEFIEETILGRESKIDKMLEKFYNVVENET